MELFKLNPKVISYWIIKRIILFLITLIGIILLIIFVPRNYLLAVLIPSGLILLLTIFYTFIMPILEYKVYRYYYDEEKIIIKGGVLFRFYRVIPIIQIQDVGTFQGPIKLAYGLADVVVATAGSVERINNVDVNISKNIVDELNMKIHKRLVEEN